MPISNSLIWPQQPRPEWMLPESKTWASQAAKARWLPQPSAGHEKLLPDGYWVAKASKGFGAWLEIGCKLSICRMALVTADFFCSLWDGPGLSQSAPQPWLHKVCLTHFISQTRDTVCGFSFCFIRDTINTSAGDGQKNQRGHTAASVEKAYWQCSKHIGA